MIPIFIAILGLFFGSFANVVIYRLRHGGSIAVDRSRCRDCKHTLGVLDLVPLFSWIFLRGKCRYCKSSISLQYPLVELIFALVWGAVSILYFDLGFLSLALLLFIASCLIILFVYDLLYYELPDQVSIPLIWASLLYFFSSIAHGLTWQSISVGAIIIYSFFYLQILIPSVSFALRNKKYKLIPETVFGYILFPIWLALSLIIPQKFLQKIPLFQENPDEEEIPVWIGGGDLRLAFIMGILLGWQAALVALFIAYILGGFVGILLIIMNKKDRKSMLPFGPFLILGTVIAFVYGQSLWFWYFQFLGL